MRRYAEPREWSTAAFWRANVVLLLVEMDDDDGGAEAMLIVPPSANMQC